MYITRNLDIDYSSDLKSFGFTEDGTEVIAEVYFVQITNRNGDRWRHVSLFPSIVVEQGEEGICFINQNDKALAWCKNLLERVRNAMCVNMQYWEVARPMYGSNAYIQYGQAQDVLTEKEEG